MKPSIDAVTWVAALDGAKALIWRNEGFDDQPNLKLLERFEDDNPADRDQSADRAGRLSDPAGGRSAVGDTDLHTLAKSRFVERVMHLLNASADNGDFDRVLVLAPAKVLGEARSHYSDALKALLLEQPVDVVNQPMDRIDAQVVAALTA
ncbi:host attachment family protein [Maricaulis parjimensis]|uniref:host attachment family protein n=1 Tax=Maricaulis parjimensis TaxID=144023 RepID=UPI00193AD8BE|nr:host attachment family protein [Maricaulis parjimensis]